MDAQLKQFFVAVSDTSLKLPTLVDLLLALRENQPFAAVVSCSSRDSLDSVVSGVRASVPEVELTFLHADLLPEQVDSVLQAFAARLKHNGEAASNGSSPLGIQATTIAGSASVDSQGDARPSTSSRSASGFEEHQQRAQILVMTNVIFKSLKPGAFPKELPLLIDFDLPLAKDAYMAQIQTLTGDAPGEQKIIIFFVLAGQIADFRALEGICVGSIDVMPVHVADIFAPAAVGL